MALATYSDLQAAVADWLERADLAGRIPDFITLAESRLNRMLRLRLMETEMALTATAGARTMILPAGFTEPVALWRELDSGREALRFVDPAAIAVSTTAGLPRAWTVSGGSIAFERPCDQAYGFTLRMLGGLSLSATVPTNPILAAYPDLYLFAALVEAAPYLRDADLMSMFSARLDAALAEVSAKEARSRALATLAVEAPLARQAVFDIRRG